MNKAFLAWLLFSGAAAGAEPVFRAGAAATDITPPQFPVRVNGMFTERSATRALDPLHARSVALDDGKTKIVFCVVDTCMMPRGLIDEAKQAVEKQTGLPAERMMVSATHTHSAPAAMGCLGSRADPGYAKWLPGKLAESMIAALENLQPARIGWASIEDRKHTHNRRWIFRQDRTGGDPFGGRTMHANMHPGHLSKNVIGPSGPVDPGLSLFAVQTKAGKPLAVFANYSQHYFGSGLLSADYYGAFCRHLAKRLEQPSSEGPFVAMISQGTSGDLMWMNYGAARTGYSVDGYAGEVADYAMRAYRQIAWHDHVPLGMTEKKLELDWRRPDEKRLAWAKGRMGRLNGKLPRSQQDIYAMEASILHEKPKAELKLQAIRIGGLGIATLPNEVYAITGLKLKAQSPFDLQFNVELANGAEGYIPPPEQHPLGGYTTWPARTAGLEVGAEPRIVETLLGALEETAGSKRRSAALPPGAYARAVNALQPVAYWRMNELSGAELYNEAAERYSAELSGRFALYLPGVLDRSVHFVDGRMKSETPVPPVASVALWYWLGVKSGASERDGELLRLPSGDALRARQGADHLAALSVGDTAGAARLPADQWRFAVLVRDQGKIRVHLDGNAKPELEAAAGAAKFGPLVLGEGLEGRLDEVALFNRALDAGEIAAMWKASGLAERRAKESAERARAERDAAERANPPLFPPAHAAVVKALKPARQARLDAPPAELRSERGVRLSPGTYAAFDAGRMRGSLDTFGEAWSAACWFRNDLANRARPVTAYLFSRGPEGNLTAPGDHLGIGGTYQANLTGRLMVFNGNDADQVLVGKSVIAPETWNHAVLARDGKRVRVYLNGELEIDGEIAVTHGGAKEFFIGARSDFFAPLQGYLADFVLFDRALTAEEAGRLCKAAVPGKGPPPAPRGKPQTESPPLSPEDGLKSIRVPAGYTVDLVACEPQVLDPVAFDWDVKGRLWVVEMADYPLGLDGKNAAGGRVRMLEDRDGDGRYETSSLFADGLNFPNGILTWRDGVIVTAAPDVLFLRDTDGDGKADEREVLLTGMTTGNQQLRANGLRWGLDNWVYVAAGGHHGKHGLGTKIRSSRAKTETAVGSRDFRFKPDTGVVEAQSGPTQFGRNRDDWGRWFGTQNSRPLWHYVLPDHYLARNPHLAAPDGRVQIPGEINPPVYPASRPQKRYHSFNNSGRYTSACAGMIFRDERLFGRDTIYGFTCEPFHNLVQRIALEPDGVTFKGRRAGGKDEPDFFASSDRWCRPVMPRTGPDGALWVADMYRYMIEHPHWLPKGGQAELLPFYREGEDRGRIYRVRKTGDAVKAIPDLQSRKGAGLTALLASSNGWVRDKAQQLLLWRGEKDVVPELRDLAENGSNPFARLHALCTLDGLDALGAETVAAALADAHPGVRENALRLAETRAVPEVQAAAFKLAGDPDAKVRMQLAFSIGAFPPSAGAGEALAGLLAAHAGDAFMRTAVLSSALPHQAALIERAAGMKQPGVRAPLLELAIGSGNQDALSGLLDPVFAEAATSLSGASVQACLELLDLLAQRKQAVPDSDAFKRLLNKARSEQTISAAALLSRVPADRAKAVTFLGGRLQASTPPDELARVLKVLGGTGDSRVPGLLIDAWPGLAPNARGLALDQLLSRNPWTRSLLDAMAKGAIRPDSFDPARRNRLVNHPDKKLRADAAKRLASAGAGPRAGVVEAYRPALKLTGVAERGRAVFVKACLVCHKLGEQGNDVGPDLRAVAAHPPEKILVNILDPNLDVQPGYHAYQCTMVDGEQLFGTIASENATGITLKFPDGKSRSLLRKDIAAMKSLDISMMPEGLEAAIDHQAMADLIAFLKSGSIVSGKKAP